ncbi:MAG: alanine racemase [Clostridia bacterium]|nr:alanine racemase [Clostridia bacterium]
MQYINFDAIIKNTLIFKSKLAKSKLCAVVKCDAYGHGIERVASCLHDIVDCFAVNDVAEALKIEKYGKDVLILLPQDRRNTNIAVEHQFVLTLDSFETLHTMLKCKSGQVRVHIKVDSGMSRLGFKLEELPRLMQLLDGKNIVVEGIFSHFYEQNKISCDEQLNYFAKCSKIVSRKFGKVIRHIANTSGVLLDERYHLDMARIGLGLYGYGNLALMVAKTVTAKVIAKKQLPKGSVIGYGAKHVCKRQTDVAIIDIGYNNGYARGLKAPIVKVGKGFAKVIGNICMSMSMVDVTGIDVKIGDDVVVLGEGVNPSTDDVIIYQLLCNLR